MRDRICTQREAGTVAGFRTMGAYGHGDRALGGARPPVHLAEESEPLCGPRRKIKFCRLRTLQEVPPLVPGQVERLRLWGGGIAKQDAVCQEGDLETGRIPAERAATPFHLFVAIWHGRGASDHPISHLP